MGGSWPDRWRLVGRAGIVGLIVLVAWASGCGEPSVGTVAGSVADADAPLRDAEVAPRELVAPGDTSALGRCDDAWLAVLPGEVWPERVAALAGGDVVVAGRFRGALALGGANLVGGAVPANNDREVFVARLEGETCAARWLVSRGFGWVPGDVAVAGDRVALVGARDVVVLDAADGEEVWTRRVDGGEGAWLSAVAIAEDGGVFVGGTGLGVLALGGLQLDGVDSEHVGFVVALDSDGAARWGSVSACDAEVNDLALTPQGEVIAAGAAAGPVALAPRLRTPCAAADDELWLAAMDGATGEVRWYAPLGLRAMGGPRVVVDEAGSVHATALYYAPDMANEGDPIAAVGESVGSQPDRQLIARLDSDGQALEARSFDAALVRHMGGGPPSLALAGDQLVVAGVVLEQTAFTADASIVPAVSGPEFEGFVARWAPATLALQDLEPFGGDGDQEIFGVAGDAAGRVWVVGRFNDELAIDGVVAPHDGPAGFIARRPGAP